MSQSKPDEQKGEIQSKPFSDTLPPEIWRDDHDPVALAAKKYERTIRTINKAMEPLPLHTRIAGYLAGAAAGVIPGIALSFLMKDNKYISHQTAELATHAVLTAGVITGMHTADKLMEEPHVNRHTKETAEMLKIAREQAQKSYNASKEQEYAGHDQQTLETHRASLEKNFIQPAYEVASALPDSRITEMQRESLERLFSQPDHALATQRG